MKKLLGVDIGGTKCSVVIGQGDRDTMTVLTKRTFSTNEYVTPERVLAKLCSETELLLEGKEADAIGISCGGPLDSKRGVILSPPNLPGWDEIAICDYFQSKFSIPTHLQNDANACAVAEWRYGAGRGCEDFIFLTFGTGLGAGLILNGKLYTGRQDMAGEVGHWRMHAYGPVGYGKIGSLEGFCSGGGLIQLAQQKLLELVQQGKEHPLKSPRDSLTAKDVFMLATQKDPLCLEVITEVGEMFGRGLAMLIDLLNPEVIVAGSVFTRNYDLLYPVAKRVIDREALAKSASSCRVLPSALGESIGDLAALATALQ